MATQEATFIVKVTNNRGKVVLEKELRRNSQWSAHTAARNIFADQPAGSHMTISFKGKVVEEWTMSREGWEFSVLNGDSVQAASRATRAAIKSALPKQKSGPASGKGKTAPRVSTKRAVKPKTKAQVTKAKASKRSAEAPF